MEAQLSEDLLSNYSATARPVTNASHPVLLRVGFALNQIIDLLWTDEFLQWNASDYQGLSEIRISTAEIWMPDLTLYNDVREEERGLDQYKVTVYPNGAVYWLTPNILKTYCKLDVTYFPYDQQVCPFKFGSWSYHGFQLDVTNRSASGDTSSFVDNGEWELVDIPVRRHVVMYGCCPEPYPDVTFYIVIKRRSLYYIFNIVLPCVLISSIALVVFYLPPESGEKIALVITVLLALTVFMLLIAEIMPPQSEVVPLIGQYFIGAIVLLSLSTALTVYVMTLYHSGNHARPVPGWLRKVAFRWLATILCMRATVKRKARVHPAISEKKDQPQHNDKETSDTKQTSVWTTSNNANDHSQTTPFSNTRDEKLTDDNVTQTKGDAEETNTLLRKILHHFSALVTSMADHKAHESIETEWHIVAKIIDRLLLVLFFTMTVTLNLFFLCFRPSYEYSVD
ncbi:neuronal acetylcholine receptor subunit alpha-9-like [Lingula anatina]|uniref:Neuronal acetylcholine receptor subunit alpha-9-like n=1 Tax=Lingula anatina TaxID=7574 RepID=A0A2R2MJC5_LINAN|nr:neuronal acetylcholine receptor subunit alpha-9-like [Lingula anatina]|eukprot:XP_023930299.1 neuronal acetylcholine receptor subunit alpha-9-like [Lingula anatina]